MTTPEDIAESSDVSALVDQLLRISDELDPTTGESKKAFDDIAASVAAQRNAVRGR